MVHNQVAVSATPTGQVLDFDQERERIRLEYEARLAQLTMQYTAEQQTSAQLQDELKKTREAYEQQLAALNNMMPVKSLELGNDLALVKRLLALKQLMEAAAVVDYRLHTLQPA